MSRRTLLKAIGISTAATAIPAYASATLIQNNSAHTRSDFLIEVKEADSDKTQILVTLSNPGQKDITLRELLHRDFVVGNHKYNLNDRLTNAPIKVRSNTVYYFCIGPTNDKYKTVGSELKNTPLTAVPISISRGSHVDTQLVKAALS